MATNLPTAAGNKNVKYYINSAICLIVMFGFGYLPPIAPITTLGMQILGIYVCIPDGYGISWRRHQRHAHNRNRMESGICDQRAVRI